MMRPPARIPTATYRIQFSRHFTFKDAERLVPYLADLGISHLYASPYLKARSGSTHGYDITDYAALNPEIGDEEGLAELHSALRQNGMGQVLDFVPNHMGIGKADNAWWLDVLEWGQASPYAEFFDIDWAPAKAELRGKVLLPFLGDHYGAVLEAGELIPSFDAAEGSFSIRYHEHLFPINPADYPLVLAPALAGLAGESRRSSAAAELNALLARSRDLRSNRLSMRHRTVTRQRAAELKASLAALAARDPDIMSVIEGALQRLSGVAHERTSFVALHRLLERQAYRLAFWRTAANEINYRRFFDINDLAGMRMERPKLFEAAHALVLRLFEEGKIDGLRIDHIDGLLDPAQYCRRLADHATERVESAGQKNGFANQRHHPSMYILVEKILARHEALRQDWPISGTTGYETLNLINGLFVHPDAEQALSRTYRQFIGRSSSLEGVVYDAKKHVMQHVLSSELQVLANDLDRISEGNWRTRDFTLASLRAALEEVAACFPVYRTYVDDAGASSDDRRDIDWAVGLARKRTPETTIMDFVHGVLTTDIVRRPRSGHSRMAVVRFAKKFQQFTGPVTAKALEDTSFYRFNRLISLNEVGGDPRRMGTTVSAFHHVNHERMKAWPHAMVATTTHDTKRAEDARTRIDVLSELCEEWGMRVRRWSTFNRRARTLRGDRSMPGRNDEYLLYQMLVGAWPNELLDPENLDEESITGFRKRFEGAAIKSVREAKERTSWAWPDEAYEAALQHFVRQILDPALSPQFISDFVGFELRVAWLGMLNSLSQAVLKLTIPGVPDVYQGAELWDYSMVDPDNRRPVDFAARANMLIELRRKFGAEPDGAPAGFATLLRDWTDGRIKLLLLTRLLALRQARTRLFLEGDYVPVEVEGSLADHVCAFARVAQPDILVVAVPRLMARLADGKVPLSAAVWGDAALRLSGELSGCDFTNVVTGEILRPERDGSGASLPVGAVFSQLPVGALLAGPFSAEGRG